MAIAPVGVIIGACMVLETSVGGILVLEALMPDERSLLRALMLLIVAGQVIAFAVWIVTSRPPAQDQREPFEGGAEA